MQRRKEVMYVAVERRQAERSCSMVEKESVDEGAVLTPSQLLFIR